MKQKFSKKTKSIVAIILATIMVFGCSFAYFSDYAATSTTGTAGTVAVSLDSGVNLLDANGKDILNPGDMRDSGFVITNEGNKSIDVRTTVALTALDRDGNAINFTGDETTQSEYDLYLKDDVELIEGYGYAPKAGKSPLAVKSIDGNKIIYTIPEYSLNGNSDKYDEVETIEGLDAFSNANDFVLVFKGGAGNEWQASKIQLDILVEAKQHENTSAGWDIVAQESVVTGSIVKDTVVQEGAITSNGLDISTVKSTLAENDWETISRVVKAGQAEAIGWQVGDVTTVTTNSGDEYDVVLIGLDQDGTNTATFMLTESVDSYRMNPSTGSNYYGYRNGTNAGGYAASEMKATLDSLALTFDNVDSMKTVTKMSNLGIEDGIAPASGKLFLLSVKEFGLQSEVSTSASAAHIDSIDAESSFVYEYFKSAANRKSIAPDASYGWLRSATNSTNGFYGFTDSGNLHALNASNVNAAYEYPTFPAFVIG